MHKKKVLFIGMTPETGGINTFILNIFLYLRDKYDFDFINISNKPLSCESLIKAKGGKIWHVGIKQNYMKYLVRDHRAKKFFKKHHNYDLIDVNTPTINRIFWIREAKKCGIKHCILHAHLDAVDNSPLYKALSKYLVRYNRHYLDNHKDIVKWAASERCGKWMFGTKSHFRVIDNGINTHLFIHNRHERFVMRRKLHISDNDKVVITTSRIEHAKNYTKIVNVFKGINNKLPSSKLVIIGDGREMPKIKQMVRSYHLDKNVIFLGNQDRLNIPKYLNVGDIMLMPSLMEGMPYALLEAQSAGVPALVSHAIPQNANVTGQINYLSLKDSDRKWASLALKMLAKPYNSTDKLGMNRCMKNSSFSLDYCINGIDNLYKKILNK